MTDEPVIITCADDLDVDDLQGRLDDLTDLDVYLSVDDNGIRVEQGPGGYDFAYPFDLDDVLDWTYHFENDYTVRYEILDDVQRLLERVPVEGRDDEEILELVETHLLSDWGRTDGSELMIMDVDGQPLELSAHFTWIGQYVGDVERPYRPDPNLKPRTRIYPDGRIVM